MKKIVLTCFSLCMLVVSLLAQIPMTRSTFTGPYNAISLPAATLSTASGDDVAQSAIPIGFTFNYLGTNYTTIGVNTNGAASFDATMSTSGTNNNLFVANAPNTTLAPWWDNIISDTILYQLQGPPGNQTFTIQWINSLSYFNTATQLLNFQIILYEGTNIIEFQYGNRIAGIVAPNESASIGLEGATGGAGNYLDAVTGSAFTSNGMLNAATQWPARNFRFTPGLPTAIAAGTYTVGLAGNYFSLSEAIADVNHRGIAGPIVLSLLDANYDVTPANGDNFFPMLLGPIAGSSSTNTLLISSASGTATIASEGTQNGNCGNAAANNVISNANEPVFALVGVSYVTLQNINLTCSANGAVDRGLQVINSSAILGAQNNVAQNISVTLNRGNIGCYGISQQAITTPTAATGANSNNQYLNLSIANVYTGIYLNGNATFPDLNCSVGTTLATQFNSIGSALADDIGGGAGNTASYGIRANNQSSVSIYNNMVRNVSHAGTASCEGIVIDAGQGINHVYRNNVHDITCTTTASTANISGIRVNLANTGAHTAYIYNNFVFGIGSSYTGVATATRAAKGIFVQATGGNNTSTIHVDFNNVRMDNSASPTLSGTCFEVGVTNGPIVNVRNNVFANFTGAQTGIAGHYIMASPTATAIGAAGSIANFNDFYLNDVNNGFTGIGAAVTYATLNNWQTGMTQDANSIAIDPDFSSSTNLHVSSVALNGTADMTGITWVTTDFDNQPRSVTPDMGADEFTPLLLDVGITSLLTPTNTGCHTANEAVIVNLKNFASVPLDFSVNPVTVTVNVSGALTQTLNLTINSNVLNANLPLPSGSTLNVPVGTIAMVVAGTYAFDAYATMSGDGNVLNDTMLQTTVSYLPGVVSALPSAVCAGSPVTLTLDSFSVGGSIQWQSSTDGGFTFVNESGSGFDSAVYVVVPTTNTIYQVLFCGNLLSTNVSVSYYPVTTPMAMNDTVCGPGQVTLSAMSAGTLTWYADSVSGNALATGATFTTSVTATDTFYVSNTSGNITQGVGLFDNSAGGGMSASNNNLIFDVFQNSVLTGVYVYPATAGNITIDLRDNANALLNTVTVAVTAADINQRTFIPLNFNLTTGTGFQLVRNASSVNLWRNNVGVTYPYTLPGVISITTSTAGNGFYYFFYDWQINYGCESPRVPLIVVVNAPPAIALSVSDSVLCVGDSTTLNVSSANTNYTYSWSPAGSLNTSVGQTVVASPTVTTMYTISANDSISGCRSTDSLLVTVNALPSITLTVFDSVICSGAADTLVASFPVQSVGLPDNSAGGGQSASVNNLIFDVFAPCVLAGVYVYPGAAGNVVIELQDNTNAVLNSFTFVATAADINQRTYVPLNFSLTPATGMQLVRNATSVNLWRNNVGVNYPYTIPGLIAITTSTAGNNFYYFFYDWQIETPGAYTYSWSSIPTGFTATGDSAFVSPTVNTQYFVQVTDTLTGCVATFSTNVAIASPVLATITGDSTLCVGDSSMLVAGFTNGDGNATYLWSASLGTTDSVLVAPAATTTYSVTVTDGCGTTSTATTTVTVSNGPPVAGFTFSVTGVNTFAFTDISTGATSWSWDFGDTQTSTAQNPTNVYASNNSYTVTLIVTNGCGSDTITQVVVVDAIASIDLAAGLSLYPNPAKDQFAVLFQANQPEPVTLVLYDLQGKQLVDKQLANVKAGTSVTLNVETYPAGMYILKITNTAETVVMKVVVE